MPAAKPKTATRGRVRAEHHITELATGSALDVTYLGKPPTLTVLGVDRVEGVGMGEFVNRWRYVLTWTD